MSVDSTAAVYPGPPEGGGSNPTSTLQIPVAKAWQRLRREQLAIEDEQTNLFGKWWDEIDTSLARARVHRIDLKTASGMVCKYEFMRTMPVAVLHCFGLYFDNDALGGVVVYGPEYAENLGVWDKYGFTGKIICLARGVCVHWAHKHAGSFLIQRSMKMLPKKYEIVTATVDPVAGEIGTIYQACGWIYAGSMNSHTNNIASAWEIKGKIVTERTMKDRFQRKFSPEEVMRAYPNAKVRQQAVKGRYFCFRGDHVEQHRAAIERWIAPYPKRAAP